VCKNRAPKSLFEFKREYVIRRLMKIDDEELTNLYSSSNISRRLNQGRTVWMGHIVRMGNLEMHKKFGYENRRGQTVWNTWE
jgi:hypothetical protein